MAPNLPLQELSNTALLDETVRLARDQRETTARLVEALALIESRGLHLDRGCSSLVDYCMRVLLLSEDEASTRARAADVGRRFPVVFDWLSEGALTLTNVKLLAPHLTQDNHLDVLGAARFKSKRQVLNQIAELSSNPLPFEVRFWVSKETFEKLQTVRDLSRHTGSDLSQIFDRALTLLLAELEHRRFGVTTQPQAPRRVRRRSRHVPAWIKRAVEERDGRQCTFVGPAGRCQARAGLEFDHIIPFALGGEMSVDNIRLRCRAHNRRSAELLFGRSYRRAAVTTAGGPPEGAASLTPAQNGSVSSVPERSGAVPERKAGQSG